MNRFEPPFEIHVHGQVVLRPDVTLQQVQEAVKPLWSYSNGRSFSEGSVSLYPEEPGIQFNGAEHILQICWTTGGDNDFRQVLDELCMNLNELSAQGATLEISFFDAQYDDEDEDSHDDECESDGTDAKDDFFVIFVGPTPQAIMVVQRDLLVQDIISVMERHCESSELGGIVTEIDRLFSERFDALSNSLEIGKLPRNPGGGHGGSGRRPRHLH